jgi:hypothetical protein
MLQAKSCELTPGIVQRGFETDETAIGSIHRQARVAAGPVLALNAVASAMGHLMGFFAPDKLGKRFVVNVLFKAGLSWSCLHFSKWICERREMIVESTRSAGCWAGCLALLPQRHMRARSGAMS